MKSENARKWSKWNERREDLKSEMDQLKGRVESARKELEERFHVSSIEAAQKEIKRHQDEISELESKVHEMEDDFDERFGGLVR